MEEEWRDIEGYDGYQVSNMGKVKSLERYIKSRGNGLTLHKGQILKNNIVNNGYYSVCLSINGIKKNKLIHQLVAIYFLGHKIDGHNIVVDHINGDKLNNRVENLRLVSQRENTSTCYRKGTETYSSQYVGVSWVKSRNKWRTFITINSKLKHLGYFNSELEASNAYQNKLKEINSVS